MCRAAVGGHEQNAQGQQGELDSAEWAVGSGQWAIMGTKILPDRCGTPEHPEDQSFGVCFGHSAEEGPEAREGEGEGDRPWTEGRSTRRRGLKPFATRWNSGTQHLSSVCQFGSGLFPPPIRIITCCSSAKSSQPENAGRRLGLISSHLNALRTLGPSTSGQRNAAPADGKCYRRKDGEPRMGASTVGRRRAPCGMTAR